MYLSLKILPNISFVMISRSEDICHLRVFAREGRLVGQSHSFGLINIYNRQRSGGNTVPADELFLETCEPILVVGDLNVHTSLTEPTRVQASGGRRIREVYVRTAALNGYTILNRPGIHRRFPDNATIPRPLVLDYTLVNASMFARITRWRDITQRT